ncbi:MAG: iron dependent repressor, metal binding and dimerization domain protein [Planctomycetota bacterium]
MTGYLVAAIVCAAVALLAWPRHGLYARWMRFRGLVRKQNLEDTLKHLHNCEYAGTQANLEGLAGVLGVARDHVVDILQELDRAGLVEASRGHPALTAAGRREALRIVRTHRLWENFLAERSGFDETRWHEEADRREHSTSSAQTEELAASLGNPCFDPHGAPIPTAAGELPASRGTLLSELQPGQVCRVIRVEDEPRALHEQLVIQGLAVGAVARVIERGPSSVRLEVGGEEQLVAHVAAANVIVESIEKPLRAASKGQRLSRIKLNQKARVVGLLPSCRGLQRRRLLDLGLVTGTIVEPELRSATGDPVAYRVRGALVALREDQANQIEVELLQSV